MRAVVVGCGTWGTVLAGLLRDRGHEVELACRDAEQAAAIRETGRNPRYATTVDLTGIERGHRLRTGGRLASLCLAGGHI